MKSHVQKTLAILLLSSVAGCASGPFHRKTPPAPALQPPPPDLSQTPLYSPEMSDGNPKVPSLPATANPVVKAPEPVVQKTHKTHKPKTPATSAKSTNTSPPSATSASNPGAAAATSGSTEAASQATVDKKPADTQQATNSAAPEASPIGELTAGDSAEAAQTSRQAEDLIKTTRNGVDSIKRELTPDEKKTVEQIRTFLKRAEQALQNSDVDGAYGLATKAKLLLDELTTK